jgi:uncharacterized protein (TIGR02996 family)
MAVYFVFRSNIAGPGCRHVHRVEVDSIIEVFRANWKPTDEEGLRDDGALCPEAEKVFGPGHWCLGELAYDAEENVLGAPVDLADLHRRLTRLAERGALNGLQVGTHHIGLIDTDDVFEYGLYIFDDHYAASHPAQAAFLLHDGWQLPGNAGDGVFLSSEEVLEAPAAGNGEGCTFVAFLTIEDYSGLSNTVADGLLCRIIGLRLPELPRYLLQITGDVYRFPVILRALSLGTHHFAVHGEGEERGFLRTLRADPADGVTWAVYSDWLADHGYSSPGQRLLAETLRRCPGSRWGEADGERTDPVIVHPHLAQACKQGAARGSQKGFHHIIAFDDLWASAHADLATGILRFASRWDVL